MDFDLKKLNDKFFTDPDWKEMEGLIENYLAPFRDVMDIKTTMSNDEIATEVRGRQMMIENLDKFLSDTKIIRSKINKPTNSYR